MQYSSGAHIGTIHTVPAFHTVLNGMNAACDLVMLRTVQDIVCAC